LETPLINECTANKRSWRILCWNIRGINSQGKSDAIKSKIAESSCDILCLQETKREFFDTQYLRNFCPPRLNDFDFLPSVGASGGCIVVWDRSKFLGSAVFQMNLATQLSSSVSLLVNTGF
jgi:mRNA deadenylase 3'-5' endonuclease subunit Ccr4